MMQMQHSRGRSARQPAPSGNKRKHKSQARLFFLVFVALLGTFALLLPVVAGPIPANKPAAYPDWWFEKDIISTNSVVTNVPPIWPSDYRPADDFAALNQGQIKFMATNAYSEMRLRLPAATWTNAPGLALEGLVSTNLTMNAPGADPYAAVNHGQLKHLAKHFYDVLNAAGYTAGQGFAPTPWTSGAYPWSGSLVPSDHYAAANLGQAKHLFSFDLATWLALDSDNDGLPDVIERRIIDFDLTDAFVTLADVDPEHDFDLDGRSNAEEYNNGVNSTDPTLFFNGDTSQVRLQVVGGLVQNRIPNSVARMPLELHVATLDGQPIANAPVTLRANGSGYRFSTPSGAFVENLTLRTDARGLVTVNFLYPANEPLPPMIAELEGAKTTAVKPGKPQVRYCLVDLQAMAGLDAAQISYSYAARVSENSNIVGGIAELQGQGQPDRIRAFRLLGGRFEYLQGANPDHAANPTYASDISNGGVAVGYSPRAWPNLRACYWPSDATQAVLLSNGVAGENSEWTTGANRINENGQILGAAIFTRPSRQWSIIQHLDGESGVLSDETTENLYTWPAVWQSTQNSPVRLNSKTDGNDSEQSFLVNWDHDVWYDIYTYRTYANEGGTIDDHVLTSYLSEDGVAIGKSIDHDAVVLNSDGILDTFGVINPVETAVSWSPGQGAANPLPGPSLPALRNTRNVLAGTSYGTGGQPYGVIHHLGKIQSLGTATLTDINERTLPPPAPGEPPLDAFQIVGTAPDSAGQGTGCLWEYQAPSQTWLKIDANALVPQSSGYLVTSLNGINNAGMTVGMATHLATGKSRAVALVPVEIAVDANRDGAIWLASDVTNEEIDVTLPEEPYRFWLNNDDDLPHDEPPFGYSPEKVPPQNPDSDDERIKSPRDLEDCARLWIRSSEFANWFTTNSNLYLAFKWKNIQTGEPIIRIFEAAESNGGLDYLRKRATAEQQAGVGADPLALQGFHLAIRNEVGFHETKLKPTTQPSDFVLPNDRWSNFNGQTASPTKFLLFEGVAAGSGELQILIVKKDQTGAFHLAGEGPLLHLDLRNVETMYQKTHAVPVGSPESNDFPAPYSQNTVPGPPGPPYAIDAAHGLHIPETSVSFGQGHGAGYDLHAFAAPPNEEPKCVVFVHGVGMTMDYYRMYSQTFFKRLWWEGYKGRFVAFRWSSATGPTGYNDGEYRAWTYGKSLKNYIASIRSEFDVIGITAHSMGNVVAGSALQKGMLVDHFIMLAPAVPTSCFNPNAAGFQSLLDAEAERRTPDGISELGYKGFLQAAASNVTGNLVNYYNEQDYWLQTGTLPPPYNMAGDPNLVYNNRYYRPNNLNWLFPGTYDFKANPSGTWQSVMEKFGDPDRWLLEPHESMAFVSRSRTRAIGAELPTGAPVVSGKPGAKVRDMRADYGFDGRQIDHSGFFNRHLYEFHIPGPPLSGHVQSQDWLPGYQQIMHDLRIAPNNP
jgi:hypothetical protein